VRHERGLGTDSPTRRDTPKINLEIWRFGNLEMLFYPIIGLVKIQYQGSEMKHCSSKIKHHSFKIKNPQIKSKYGANPVK